MTFDLSRIVKGRGVYAAALIGLLFYLMYITEPVPNFNQETQTIIKGPSDFIVPTNVTYFWAVLGSALVVALFMSDVQGGRKITAREAAKIAYDEVIYRRDILKDSRFIGGVIEAGNVRPRRIVTKQGSEIFKWVIGMNVKQEYIYSYYQIELNTEGVSEAILQRKWEFGLVDICWKCGEHGDIRVMLPQEIYDLRNIRGVVSR